MVTSDTENSELENPDDEFLPASKRMNRKFEETVSENSIRDDDDTSQMPNLGWHLRTRAGKKRTVSCEIMDACTSKDDAVLEVGDTSSKMPKRRRAAGKQGKDNSQKKDVSKGDGVSSQTPKRRPRASKGKSKQKDISKGDTVSIRT